MMFNLVGLVVFFVILFLDRMNGIVLMSFLCNNFSEPPKIFSEPRSLVSELPSFFSAACRVQMVAVTLRVTMSGLSPRRRVVAKR